MATFETEEEPILFYPQTKPNFNSNTWSNNRRKRPPLLKNHSVKSSEDENLSILDLQTLRRDSKVQGLKLDSTIRPPQQNVFKLHKPGFHISTERVWFPRRHSNSEESTTLGDEEVEVKLPCRSVSINVVGMPTDDEVNARPSPPCSNDFQETIQAGCQQPLLLTNNVNNGLRQNSNSYGVQCSGEKSIINEVEKLSPCCRYRKPAIVSLISVGLIMIVTFLVLYWNYHETIHRRMTKKQGYILDHWGKGSPSAAETAILDLEVEILKGEERKKKVDDLLVIDGRPLDSLSGSKITSSTERSLDSRVD